uniref:Zinc finger protein 385A n=1 Tax=Salarias fasciatus TaxID=181472 RepID=A0A672JMZ1_SALFA
LILIVKSNHVNRPGPVPAFLRSPPVIPSPLDMKPFLQFPLESPHPASIGLFHNFNTSQAEAHYKGNRHARRVKGIETSKTTRLQDGDKQQPVPPASPPGPVATPLPSSPSPAAVLGAPPADPSAAALPDTPSPAPSPSSGESEEEKAKKLLYCSLCKVAVNSLSQLEAHNKGTKHKTILEARSGLGPIKAYPRLVPKPSSEQGGEMSSDPNTQERTFHCEICNVRVNSELQLKQHISSRRHRDGVAGKPNPLLSRHKKRTDFMLCYSLRFSVSPRKELPKTLGAGLLPSPLAVAAAMAAAASSNQLSLRPPGPTSHPHPHHHHLLQGTPLSLLRPAPGPIRTTHGPILFTPY